LANPQFTGLGRFLSPDPGRVQAFQTIQKLVSAIDAEIRHLANPVSLDFLPLAGGIEDHGTNAVAAAQKARHILDRIWTIFAVEALHGAQAVDLRATGSASDRPGGLYRTLRAVVPFLDDDRNLHLDIEVARTSLRR
jgi:histidine ammonia-lyase